jgi:hypothetical protein
LNVAKASPIDPQTLPFTVGLDRHSSRQQPAGVELPVSWAIAQHVEKNGSDQRAPSFLDDDRAESAYPNAGFKR